MNDLFTQKKGIEIVRKEMYKFRLVRSNAFLICGFKLNRRRYDGHLYVGFYNFLTPAIVLRDPELINHVLIKNFDNFQDTLIRVADPIAGRNPFFTGGGLWKILRKQLSPVLSYSKLKYANLRTEQVCKDMVEWIKQTRVEIDVEDLAYKFTGDNVMSCAYDLDNKTFLNNSSIMQKILNRMTQKSYLGLINHTFGLFLPNFSKIFKISYLGSPTPQLFIDTIEMALYKRQQSKVSCKDFLDFLLEIKNKNGKQYLSHAMTIFIDGFDTSAVVLTYALLEIATHFDIQEVSAKEVDTVFNEYNTIYTSDAIKKLVLIENIILETLRKHTLIKFLNRVCVKDCILPHPTDLNKTVVIQKGTQVFIPSETIHRDPKYYSDPHKFDPFRFNEKAKYNKVFFGFGNGPRICIGRHFAMTQIKLALATILLHFKLCILGYLFTDFILPFLKVSVSVIIIMPLNTNDTFDSYKELQDAVDLYEKENRVQFWKRDAKTITSAKHHALNLYKTVQDKELDLKYYYIKYACIHGGQPFRPKNKQSSIKNCRNHDGTYKQDCNASITVGLKDRMLVIKNILNNHNHEIPTRKSANMELFQMNLIHKRWSRSHIEGLASEGANSATQNNEMEENVLLDAHQISITNTTSTAPKTSHQKFKKAQAICMELATLCSEVSTREYEERMEILSKIHTHWQKHEQVVVSTSIENYEIPNNYDEPDQQLANSENIIDAPVAHSQNDEQVVVSTSIENYEIPNNYDEPDQQLANSENIMNAPVETNEVQGNKDTQTQAQQLENEKQEQDSLENIYLPWIPYQTSCVSTSEGTNSIKYSDPKYNINDLKTGDCETMLLNQTIYYLNKSKSKWISVGLYYPFEFASVVKIFGRSKQYVIFKEEEWIQFHEQRENINKYFQTFDTMWKPRQIGSKTLTFEMIEEKKILKIEDMSGNEVYLGWESVSEVWSLESVLRYRLSYSSRLLKKMWMLYAQEHWTKCYDLKSAVERLYEELGALEFDADHEAIYGMEDITRSNSVKSFEINIRLEGRCVESSYKEGRVLNVL
ncbi:hypothetical protein FQA39_LY17835 [Lamprigera yunnana]|nr:hypothetical protein FQA39_LY17835 [Lamprigera yunnana]